MQNPHKWGFCIAVVRPRGIEPRLRDPQSRVLSVERRAHYYFARLMYLSLGIFARKHVRVFALTLLPHAERTAFRTAGNSQTNLQVSVPTLLLVYGRIKKCCVCLLSARRGQAV